MAFSLRERRIVASRSKLKKSGAKRAACEFDRFQYPGKFEIPAHAGASIPRGRTLQWLRILLTAAAVAGFIVAALFDQQPLVMLVGLAPLALIAGEAVWHSLAGLYRRDSSAD
jgi:hypothetical protein